MYSTDEIEQYNLRKNKLMELLLGLTKILRQMELPTKPRR
jgi:hypothetical protein